jgi:hypothetical protein
VSMRLSFDGHLSVPIAGIEDAKLIYFDKVRLRMR